jgi:fluoride exporter
VTELPRDSDIDLHDQRQRRELHPDVLVTMAVGGACGASARYGIGLLIPPGPTGFPWATFLINVSGCLLLGVLMVVIALRFPRQRLIRPFLGVGVLGGFTTFSTYVVDIQRLVDAGAAATALWYLAATLVAAVLATYVGLAGTRLVLGRLVLGRVAAGRRS